MPILQVNFQSPNGTLSPAQGLQAHGPTIRVVVGKHPSPDQSMEAAPNPKQVLALIDTGASHSCIDERLAQELRLPVIDEREVGGVAGRRIHNIFLAHVIVPELGTQSKGSFIGVDLSVNQPVILGRDFLAGSVLVYNGPGGSIILSR